MTTNLSADGQILLPASVRKQLNLLPGDDFEVAVEDDYTITLRRIASPANDGVVDLLLSCPAELEISRREDDDTEFIVF